MGSQSRSLESHSIQENKYRNALTKKKVFLAKSDKSKGVGCFQSFNFETPRTKRNERF
jgi:hypothetical protein